MKKKAAKEKQKLKTLSVTEAFKEERLDLIQRTYAKATISRHCAKAIGSMTVVAETVWTKRQAALAINIATQMRALVEGMGHE